MNVANASDVRHAYMVNGFGVMDVGCTFQPVNIKTITQYFSMASQTRIIMNNCADT